MVKKTAMRASSVLFFSMDKETDYKTNRWSYIKSYLSRVGKTQTEREIHLDLNIDLKLILFID